MASTYSTSLRLELMATGDQSGTWGVTTNTNLGTLLEQSITGVLSVAQGDVANLTLTTLNGASDQSRNMVLNLTGAMTAGRNVVVPTANKIYLVKNSTTGGFAVTVKTTAGTGIAVRAGATAWLYCDGTNVLDGLPNYYQVGGTDVAIADGGTGAGTAVAGNNNLNVTGANIATGATVDLATATGNSLTVTGTSTVASFGTVQSGAIFQITAAANFTLTYNATSMQLPGQSNATIRAGDVITMQSLGSGNWKLIRWQAYSGFTVYSPGTLYGMTLANNGVTPASQIDIAVGACADSTGLVNIDLLTALTAKDLSVAWAAGSSAGMLASGAAVANATYHIFAIKRPDTGAADVAADTSVTGANIPANTNAAYTVRRRIGSIIRTGGAIIPFLQDGKRFTFKTPETTVAATDPGTSAVTRAMQVPLGIRVGALVNIGFSSDVASTDFLVMVTDLAGADVTPIATLTDLILQSPSTAGAYRLFVPKTVMTDALRQVRTRLGFSSPNTQLRIMTYGWEDISL